MCPNEEWSKGVPEKCSTCPWFLDGTCGCGEVERVRGQNKWLRDRLQFILDKPWWVKNG